jgi:outer membrane protein assembly factor BamB
LKIGNKDGAVQWEFNTTVSHELGPVYKLGDALYVGGDTGNFTPVTALGGYLHSVQPSDGKHLWTYNAEAPLSGLEATRDSSAFIATTFDGNLHSFRSSDGKQLWKVKASFPQQPGRFFPTSMFSSIGPPVLSTDNESVYLYGATNLHAFDIKTGHQKWNVKEAIGGGDGCPINRPLLAKASNGDELIYGFANDTQKPRPYPAGADPDVLVTRTKDLQHDWRSHPGFEGPCPWMWSVSNDGRSLFTMVELGNFYLHALHTSNGTRKWEFQCPEMHASTMIV